MQTIEPKILEIPEAKLNGKKTSGKKFGYTSRGCPLFRKFWKMLFHSLLEVAENSNQAFWLNGKRPRLTSLENWAAVTLKTFSSSLKNPVWRAQKIGLLLLQKLDAI